MRIAIYHGYELTGSGSNEYTRYLAAALAGAGHEVHVICREPAPESLDFLSAAYDWNAQGEHTPLALTAPARKGSCTLQRMPHGPIRPVFLTDKQRDGVVKSFTALSDAELAEYHQLSCTVLRAILESFPVDVLHANHLVYQPMVAADVCEQLGTPWIVYPHGSSIEYTVRADERYEKLARHALRKASGLISGSEEVRQRILDLYPEDAAELDAKCSIVGVGVDTALFRPRARDERSQAFAELAGRGPFRGKSPAQDQELCTRLDQGDLGAVTDYHSAYDHSAPDQDLSAKLEKIPHGAPLLLFVGALTAGKGVHSLLAALPEVLCSRPDAHLLIVGSGAYREVLEGWVHAISTGNRELCDTLVQRGFDLDRSDLTQPWNDVADYLAGEGGKILFQNGSVLRDHVHFLGRMDHQQLRLVFPFAHAAVFPSVVPEAYPLVLMESLANSVFPMVSDFSGFADGLRSLEPMLGAELVDRMRLPADGEGRVAGIARNLAKQLAVSDQELDTLRPKLREVAERHYDWTVRAQQMSEAYQNLLVSTSPR